MTDHKEDCSCEACAAERAQKDQSKYLCTSCGFQTLQAACGICKCPTCGGEMHPETPHRS